MTFNDLDIKKMFMTVNDLDKKEKLGLWEYSSSKYSVLPSNDLKWSLTTDNDLKIEIVLTKALSYKTEARNPGNKVAANNDH